MAYNPIGQGLAGLGQGVGQMLGAQRQEGILKGLLQSAQGGDEAALMELATSNPQVAQFLMSRDKMEADKQRLQIEDRTQNVGIIAQTALGISDPVKRRSYLMERLNTEQDPEIKAELADTLNMDDDQMAYDLQEAVSQWSGYRETAPSKMSAFEEKMRMAGIDPGTPEGQAAVRQYLMKPDTQVNIGPDKRETKFNETVGKGFGEMFLDLQKGAAQARTSNVRLQRAEQLVDQVATGTGQPTIQWVKRLGKSVGVDLESIGVTDDTAPAEALQALGTSFALDAVAATKGAVSDKEMSMFEQMAPSLSRTPQGNKLLIEMAKRMNDLNIQQASLARDYIRKNGGVLDEGYYDTLDQFHAQNPLFTESLQKRLATIEKSGATMAPQNADRPIAVNPETGQKMRWNPSSGQWEAM